MNVASGSAPTRGRSISAHPPAHILLDIIKSPYSAVLHSELTVVWHVVKVVAWRNEWGYCNCVVDLVQQLL